MFQNIGFTEILLVALVCLLLFGPSKLPELGKAFGRTLREFKNGAREMMSESESEDKKAVKAPEATQEAPVPASLTQQASQPPVSASAERSDNPRRLPD
ncbi:twin-arginine translocase TatA/TatE family subunit [Paenibacillus sp. FJAT-26967]|uniref:twin-arginine translocase TatA/TatE family subunit n=1 Tax=Paenibacillus sp. FJAT-26967 TaxID=1729690 RepID=UPI0008386334|nr:twin-arginine translocase TatA/TatE family subunit [Paenibacillus sp. FJAT-26967]